MSRSGKVPAANESLNNIFKGAAIDAAVITKKKLEMPSSPAPLSVSRRRSISLICFFVTYNEEKVPLVLDGGVLVYVLVGVETDV